ncbi:OmpA family protein [Paracoccus lutimaris]|uniref:OmpA family protein n=1 Tax=Paracoccus lutimaris TaxID=1490030 RepID=A0A368ZBX2_9RHOB|nr:OmpA family protein [Paracoccus lutimaris]RCW89006.1 OmpA family protein [Paracoccus lutimaris]
MRARFIFSALATTLIGTAPALAQDDLSVDQVLGAWQKQKQIFHEAQSSGLGQTRGLKLIAVEGVDAAETAPQQGVSVTASTDAPTSTDTTPMDPNKPLVAATATTTTTTAPLVFGQLDPELQVNLQIKFGFDSAALADDQKPRLDKICQAMKLSDVQLFRIVGHTDTAGTDTYNERLSVLRAKEVARYLVEDCNITASRLETLGLGERFPLNQDDPRADENRRVEFQALS